jgi:hypothetical protein
MSPDKLVLCEVIVSQGPVASDLRTCMTSVLPITSVLGVGGYVFRKAPTCLRWGRITAPVTLPDLVLNTMLFCSPLCYHTLSTQRSLLEVKKFVGCQNTVEF